MITQGSRIRGRMGAWIEANGICGEPAGCRRIASRLAPTGQAGSHPTSRLPPGSRTPSEPALRNGDLPAVAGSPAGWLPPTSRLPSDKSTPTRKPDSFWSRSSATGICRLRRIASRLAPTNKPVHIREVDPHPTSWLPPGCALVGASLLAMVVPRLSRLRPYAAYRRGSAPPHTPPRSC